MIAPVFGDWKKIFYLDNKQKRSQEMYKPDKQQWDNPVEQALAITDCVVIPKEATYTHL